MTVLKSINITEDFAFPIRANHYRPTSKSLEIVRAVLGTSGSKATSVIASYGSGKSIAAMIGGLIVEADLRKISEIEEAGLRLKNFDSSLSVALDERISNEIHGIVVTLSGHVPNVIETIAHQLGFEAPNSMTKLFRETEKFLKKNGHDRIAIIWDEFGRHLEALVSNGCAEELALVQDLAEWVARRKSPSATLTLLLHQEFNRYVGRLGQVDQSVWKKIEGRFETLHVVEDSDEIFPFIADVVQGLVPNVKCRIPAAVSRRVREAGLFPFLSNQQEIQKLVTAAAPLSPTTLYLLPVIAGRVGQSERSIFGFLEENLSEGSNSLVSVEDLYQYFSEAMRTDIGVGGTHKLFIECESARGRAKNAAQREILASTALLHLGSAFGKGAVSRERLLELSDLGSSTERAKLEEAISDLLDRKLLLHRKLTDEISVWQGADVDIRALAREKADSLLGSGTAVERISTLISSPTYLASEYNFVNKITRFAPGVFVKLEELKDRKRRAELVARADEHDALVALVVDGAVDDFKDICGSWLEQHPHLIIALQNHRPELDSACLEASALSELAADEGLLGMDPLVAREINDLRQSALEYVSSRAAYLTDPESGEVSWFSGRQVFSAARRVNASEILSEVFKKRFPLTPQISNEQIVRNKVTAQTKSARKRLLLGILERSNIEDMGYSNATSADASIYRTTIIATGLFNPREATWRAPKDILDPSLSETWSIIQKFYAVPSSSPKSFNKLIETLVSEPFGIRRGLLPILLTAGLRAFGEVVAIRKQSDGTWRYVDDVQPSLMEEICLSPEVFELEVVKTTKLSKACIRQLTEGFNALPDEVETDIVRAFYDAVVSWQRTLPPAALKSRGLGSEASKLQSALRQAGNDPVSLLFRAFPSIAGREILDSETILFVSTARQQIEQMTLRYVESAITASVSAFTNMRQAGDQNLLDVSKVWADQIPTSVLKDPTLDLVSKGILNRARKSKEGNTSEASLVRAFSAMLVGLNFEEWDDAVVRRYSREIRMRVREIEDAAANLEAKDPEVAPFLKKKIETYVQRLADGQGPSETTEFVEKLLRSLQ
ncbi:hypothetical protein Q8W25_15990 [Shimia thalassica]|uniref:hypothetical protein n=1 Tax=Shimia thalassica TaxID=1715693 RepID=UPI00273352A8|nr:hypothetical protein [Shimia thalassica]MDP2495532.1 hypothetical protein [Shimia thalassica]